MVRGALVFLMVLLVPGAARDSTSPSSARVRAAFSLTVLRNERTAGPAAAASEPLSLPVSALERSGAPVSGPVVSSARVRAAVAISRAMMLREVPIEPATPPVIIPVEPRAYSSYEAAYNASLALEKPLLVHVGQGLREDFDKAGDWLHLEAAAGDAWRFAKREQMPCVVVSRPDNGVLWRLAILPGRADASQVEAVLRGGTQQYAPAPGVSRNANSPPSRIFTQSARSARNAGRC